MREVLFRGKAKAIAGCPYNNGKSDGEWVFGYIFPDLGAMKIRQFEPDRPECNDYEIDPETVGQYTGLTDKNGVRIFEGDIVDYISSDVIGNPKTGTIIVEDMTDYDTMIYLNHSEELQIIGNIHDNPDILKGGEDNG